MQNNNKPDISIIIPIHNEEAYLIPSIDELCAELQQHNIDDYEVILAENGSTDKTIDVAGGITEKRSNVRLLEINKADYGNALKEAMKVAEGNYIVQYDLDYCDVSFLRKTVLLMREFEYNIIIGSKNMLLSNDERHPLRRLISQGFRFFLFIFFRLKVSDTHGVKAWKNNAALQNIIAKTRFTRHIFDTELVLRGQKEGFNIIEIPMTVIEKRPSTTKSIIKRVPEAITDLSLLWWELYVKEKS